MYTFIIGALYQIILAEILNTSLHPSLLSSSIQSEILRGKKNIPKMHSLNPNRTIPHPLNPTLFPHWRSRTLPSLPILLESTPRSPECLSLSICLRGEELGPECGTSGAEEGGWCWHFCDCLVQLNSELKDSRIGGLRVEKVRSGDVATKREECYEGRRE